MQCDCNDAVGNENDGNEKGSNKLAVAFRHFLIFHRHIAWPYPIAVLRAAMRLLPYSKAPITSLLSKQQIGTSVSSSSRASNADYQEKLRPVKVWLYALALLVLLMVTVGGITRLTDSGLSITSWKPLSGAIPPLSVADWQAEFDAYKQIPEFQLQNSWMDLNEFKSIFWWEWGHRFLGRVIGLAFAIPFLIFLFQKRLDKKLAPALAILFVLGGFQGFLGWWMVSSGLSERIDVSQYRLAAHLGAACILFGALIWVARSLPSQNTSKEPVKSKWFLAVIGFTALIYLQIIAGAFVAGLDAGYIYNTWPLMNGALIPSGLFELTPAWLNMFENVLTVQFLHRGIAYFIVIIAIFLEWRIRGTAGVKGVHGWFPRIGMLVGLQAVLGIATLLLVVPLPLAIGHQALAFMLFGTCIAYLADMRKVAR